MRSSLKLFDSVAIADSLDCVYWVHGQAGRHWGEGAESGANASLHLNINKHGVPSKMPRELLLLQLRDFHESSPSATPLLARGEAKRKGVAIATERAVAELWPKRRRVMQPARSIFTISLSLTLLSLSLSQPALRQPFVGAPFGPLAVARFCHFWPFTQASLGPELPFMQSFIRSLTHSLIASFIHSILITLWPVSCHKLQQH